MALCAGSLAALLAIWLGYPLAVWVVAAMVRRPVRPNFEQARLRPVSAVLATRESAQAIRARIDNLFDTDHPRDLLEIIVALDASGENVSAAQFADLAPRVRAVVGDAAGGKAATLNAGVRAASHEVLVFADTAQRFDRQTIPTLAACLEDSRFGAISGALKLGANATGASPVHWYWTMEKALRSNEASIHSAIGVTGAVYATRRSIWPVVPEQTLLDDLYVPMALALRGHRVGFTYLAHAVDTRAFDAAAEGVRKTRTLTGVLQLLRLLPDVLSTRNPVLPQFVFHKLARLATPLISAIVVISGASVATVLAIRWPLQVLAPSGALLVLALVVPQSRRPLIALVKWSLSMQSAVLTALKNAARGRWSVWNDGKR